MRPVRGGGVPAAENVVRAHVNRNASGTVLFVDGFGDPVLERWRAALEAVGQPTERVRDVYAAMARLSETPAVSRVIVDVRYLDEAESAFLALAPRYYQNVDIMVPALDGPSDWMNIDAPGVHRVSLESLMETAGPSSRGVGQWSEPAASSHAGGAKAETACDAADRLDESTEPTEIGVPLTQSELEALAQDGYGVTNGEEHHMDGSSDADEVEGPRSMPVLPDRPLSTDREPGEMGDVESLHDAVRRRMSGERGKVVRRRPPGSGQPDEGDGISTPFHDELPCGDLSDDEWSREDEDELLKSDEWVDPREESDTDEGARG